MCLQHYYIHRPASNHSIHDGCAPGHSNLSRDDGCALGIQISVVMMGAPWAFRVSTVGGRPSVSACSCAKYIAAGGALLPSSAVGGGRTIKSCRACTINRMEYAVSLPSVKVYNSGDEVEQDIGHWQRRSSIR